MTSSSRLTLANGSYLDCSAAMTASFHMLSIAAGNAVELLTAAGFAGMPGDTADELRLAVARQQHLLSEFNVKVRTEADTTHYKAQAASSYDAYEAAADKQGDIPCGISVQLAKPDNTALAAAHKALTIGGTLESALNHPALSIALHSYARKHRRHAPFPAPLAPDFKQRAANDLD